MVEITYSLFGGFSATLAMTGFMMTTKGDLSMPTAVLWAKYVGSGEPDEYLWQGLGLHLLYGTIAGGVFAWIVSAFGLNVSTLSGGLLWGIVWGIILFMIGLSFWMMIVLDISLNQESAIRFGGSHLVYGIVLGLWAFYIAS